MKSNFCRDRQVVMAGSIVIVLWSAWIQSKADVRNSTIADEEAVRIGIEAYIYGYPLVSMEMTRRVMTNVSASEGSRAPMGQFANAREYPDASFRDVTTPNADTLYSVAWLDLSREPYVLHVPDEHDRYYLMPMLDAWTNIFASPGTRTTGTKAGDFVIAGPHWTGKPPKGLEVFRSSTDLVWIIGRTYSSGTAEDYQEVHAIQDQYSLRPLSAYGKSYTPPVPMPDPNINMNLPPRRLVDQMNALLYFKTLAMLMKNNPPGPEDFGIISRMARIGIVPGKEFDTRGLDPARLNALNQAEKIGLEVIQEETGRMGTKVNGWRILVAGRYGTDYLLRAAVAFAGLGANLPEDALYPLTTVDNLGQPLNGANQYVLHFAKDNMPPVNGLWSLTMYNAEYFFVENPLHRYALGQKDKFNVNRDGSIDVLIQHEPPPGDLQPNWLPAPEGDFALALRLYWPREAVLNGNWGPPPVVKRVQR